MISNRECTPCGQVYTDVTQTPSTSYVAVNPTENYLASIGPTKRTTYYDGFFLGAGFGVGDVNYHYKVGGINPFNLVGGDRTFLTTRFTGGYAFTYCYFYLALELSYIYRSRNNPTHYDDDTSFGVTNAFLTAISIASNTVIPCDVWIDLYSEHAGAADILPGFVYKRFLAFLRIGVEQTKYYWQRHICIPNASLLNGPVGPFGPFGRFESSAGIVNDLSFVDSSSKSASGIRLGAGLAWAAGCHVSFNLNYIHTFGSKISFTPTTGPEVAAAIAPDISGFGDSTVTTVNVSQLTASNTIQPQRDEVLFGVTFTF